MITLAQTRLQPGCSAWLIREDSLSENESTIFQQGEAKPVI
jgi:hypothetical protein